MIIARSVVHLRVYNASAMRTLKSIITENFGNFLNAYWAKFGAYLTEAHSSFAF